MLFCKIINFYPITPYCFVFWGFFEVWKSLPYSFKLLFQILCLEPKHFHESEICLPLCIFLSTWAHSGERRRQKKRAWQIVHSYPCRGPLDLTGKPTSVQEKWRRMTLRMFALIKPKPICVRVRSWLFNPAHIPGPDIKSALESHGARLAVMLEEGRLWPTPLTEAEGGLAGANTHTFIPLFSIPARTDQEQKNDKCLVQCRYHKHSLLICHWQDLWAGDRPPSDGAHPGQWSVAGPAQSQAWPVQGNARTHTH